MELINHKRQPFSHPTLLRWVLKTLNRVATLLVRASRESCLEVRREIPVDGEVKGLKDDTLVWTGCWLLGRLLNLDFQGRLRSIISLVPCGSGLLLVIGVVRVGLGTIVLAFSVLTVGLSTATLAPSGVGVALTVAFIAVLIIVGLVVILREVLCI